MNRAKPNTSLAGPGEGKPRLKDGFFVHGHAEKEFVESRGLEDGVKGPRIASESLLWGST